MSEPGSLTHLSEEKVEKRLTMPSSMNLNFLIIHFFTTARSQCSQVASKAKGSRRYVSQMENIVQARRGREAGFLQPPPHLFGNAC